MDSHLDSSEQQLSYMAPHGYQNSTCGYCKSRPRETSPNYYLFSPRLVTPEHYEGLVDRGFRRSGTTFYKPNVRRMCCPHYTIRLDSMEFKPTKDQRKVVNKFSKYIIGADYKYKAARLCPKTREEKKRRRNNFDLVGAVQQSEYKNILKPVDPSTDKPIEPAHEFKLTLEPDDFTEEKYNLFAHYQFTVHKEPSWKVSKSGFKGFLCSGMARSTFTGDRKERQIGSFHSCYRIDGRLVAMGVLDLTPNCVSSVYLIYHEDFNAWNFGKLSAMHEIAFALEAGYRYYYMGYYIHSCIKMKYKRKFRRTFVLDPESYEWNLFDQDLLARMNARAYVSLSREKRLGIPAGPSTDSAHIHKDDVDDQDDAKSRSAFTENMPGILSVDDIVSKVNLADLKVKLRGEVHSLGMIGDWNSDEARKPHAFQGVLAEFVACVGPDLAKNIAIIAD